MFFFYKFIVHVSYHLFFFFLYRGSMYGLYTVMCSIILVTIRCLSILFNVLHSLLCKHIQLGVFTYLRCGLLLKQCFKGGCAFIGFIIIFFMYAFRCCCGFRLLFKQHMQNHIPFFLCLLFSIPLPCIYTSRFHNIILISTVQCFYTGRINSTTIVILNRKPIIQATRMQHNLCRCSYIRFDRCPPLIRIYLK
ncbi:pCP204L [African swine fever virus]|uniref:PCP204L n=1 Tax=African swine fever virus TaxID=10497 RepID=A0A894KR47_ASF|nr:pCP204L [African swine fever virus]